MHQPALAPEKTDYESLQLVMDAVARFSNEQSQANAGRFGMLKAIEENGLPLQHRIVDQYLHDPQSSRLAKQAFWRASKTFWSLLAAAWFNMLRHAYKGPAQLELQPLRAEIAVRALHYVGMVMRWDYHASESPDAVAWQRVHNIYRMAERDGFADVPVTLDAHRTTCAREYSLTLLLGTTNPLGCQPQEIEAISQMFGNFPDLPLPEADFKSGHHTHVVDLAANEAPSILQNDQPTGTLLRFLSLTPLVEHLNAVDPLQDTEAKADFFRQMANRISSDDVRRSSHRSHRFEQVWVASGMVNILASLSSASDSRPRQNMERWMLRDESVDGMGFRLEASTALPHGRLIAVSSDPAGKAWQLLAIRWNQAIDGYLLVGAQRLSHHPRRIEIGFGQDTPSATRTSTHAVLLSMSDSEADQYSVLLPRNLYQHGARISFRDEDTVHEAYLGQIYEDHERWLRINVEILCSEQTAAAA